MRLLPFSSTLKMLKDKIHSKCTQFAVLIYVETFVIFLGCVQRIGLLGRLF